MKFNKTSKGANKTVNLAGGKAFKESLELELVSLLLTSFVEDKFYESSSAQLARLRSLVTSTLDKKFIAKAGIYARNEFGMRSISHALVSELAHIVKGEVWFKDAIAKTIRRPDDMTEILSCYINTYGKPIPNSLKKGLALAFNKFDAYSLGKYRGETHAISLVDVVNLVHPSPMDKNKDALSKLVKGELKSEDTWEVELTKAGQNARDENEKVEFKASAWKELIQTRKLGIFACLRNLRNIIEQSPDSIDGAISILTDEILIKKSLILPFRYATALSQIEQMSGPHIRKVVDAIHKALDISLSNIPVFEGKTLIVLDESGSMSGKPGEIGSLFAAALYKTNDADLMTFSDKARYRIFYAGDSIMTIAGKLKDDFASGGTDFNSIFDKASQKYARIVTLSDMQGWIGGGAPTLAFSNYKKRTKSEPKIFSFDLAGHGTLQFPQQNVYAIAGFSEKVLDLMKALDTDRQALINKINSVDI